MIIQVIPSNGETAATTMSRSPFTADLNRSAFQCFFFFFFFFPPTQKTKLGFLVAPKIRSRHVCFKDVPFACDTATVAYSGTTSVNVQSKGLV